jgi:hypothetical protein
MMVSVHFIPCRVQTCRFEFGVRRINLDWCNPKPTLVCITHLKRRTDFSKASKTLGLKSIDFRWHYQFSFQF